MKTTEHTVLCDAAATSRWSMYWKRAQYARSDSASILDSSAWVARILLNLHTEAFLCAFQSQPEQLHDKLNKKATDSTHGKTLGLH